LKVAVIGGGPAGLYFSLLLKKARPDAAITVFERNRPDDTFGWGVVFSDQTMENFRAADAPTFEAITSSFAHWDDIDVHVRGRVVRSSGHGFAGIARRKLLHILQDRCAGLGVDLRFQIDLKDDAELAKHGLGDADVIVAADGINSLIRAKYAAHFEPDLDVRSAKFIWLGTTFPFDAFTFYFVENEHGVFQVHHDAMRVGEREQAVLDRTADVEDQPGMIGGAPLPEVLYRHRRVGRGEEDQKEENGAEDAGRDIHLNSPSSASPAWVCASRCTLRPRLLLSRIITSRSG